MKFPPSSVAFSNTERLFKKTSGCAGSGTGKELIARALHFQGKQPISRFLAVNCAAIPNDLLENQLFGHRKGAFTGADRDQAGIFVHAADGTVFLDEIAELPMATQAKMLRAIEM